MTTTHRQYPYQSPLPFELTERILVTVHAQDFGALSSCALASHQFLSIVRPLRFTTIKVSTLRAQQVQKFAQLLVKNLGLSSYIRSFSFAYHYTIRRGAQPPSPWTIIDPGKDLSAIFSNLPNVVSLQITSPFFKMTSWTAIADAIQASLLNLLRQPSLQSIALIGLADLPASLFRFVSFSSLSLWVCTFGTHFGEEKARISSIETLQLWSNTVETSFMDSQIDFVLHPHTPICVQNLRQLYFRVRELITYPRIMTILGLCRDSLEVLGFDISAAINFTSFDGFSLSDFSRLKELRLRLNFLQVEPQSSNPRDVSSFANFVSTICTQHLPECFELLYFELNTIYTTKSSKPLELDVWEELDKSMAALIEHMTEGGEVQITLKENDHGHTKLISNAGVYFPRCNETGRLILLPIEEGGQFRN